MFLLNTVLLLAHSSFVCGILNNLALGKPTKSSTNTNIKGRAVDGNRDAAFSGNSCWESQDEDMQPYWLVDLQRDFLLEYVTITNRGDCCGDRMHDLKIEVFADDPVLNTSTPSQLCAMYDGPMPDGATENISCSCAAQGRYIRIQGLARRYAMDKLTLCEVEVYERTPTGYVEGDDRDKYSIGRYSLADDLRTHFHFGVDWSINSHRERAKLLERRSHVTINVTGGFSTDLHRLVGTRYVGDVITVDVASAADCSTHCIYSKTCIGFNYNYNTHGCELRVGSAEASSAIGWFYFFNRPCL